MRDSAFNTEKVFEILEESHVFNQAEFKQLIKKLLLQISLEQRVTVEARIGIVKLVGIIFAEFRKQVQFMYPGKLRRVKFIYRSSSVEAVLDKNVDGSLTITAESYGDGIALLLFSNKVLFKIMMGDLFVSPNTLLGGMSR